MFTNLPTSVLIVASVLIALVLAVSTFLYAESRADIKIIRTLPPRQRVRLTIAVLVFRLVILGVDCVSVERIIHEAAKSGVATNPCGPGSGSTPAKGAALQAPAIDFSDDGERKRRIGILGRIEKYLAGTLDRFALLRSRIELPLRLIRELYFAKSISFRHGAVAVI
jgi:hypothetical protein